MGIIKKTVHILAKIIYVFVGIYVLVCIPMIFGYKPLVVLTGSMEPTYKVGSVLYYKYINPDELKVGDPITFKTKDGKFVSHRIHSIENNGFVTKGDANNVEDAGEPLSKDMVLGKDSKISIPIIGYFIKLMSEKIYLVVIIVIILILEFLFSNSKEVEK